MAKTQLTAHKGRLYDSEAYRAMHEHLWIDHDRRVYIGNVLEIHSEDFPECQLSEPIFKSTRKVA